MMKTTKEIMDIDWKHKYSGIKENYEKFNNKKWYSEEEIEDEVRKCKILKKKLEIYQKALNGKI